MALTTCGELPVHDTINIVLDARHMAVAPSEIDVSRMPAIKLTFVGVVAIGAQFGMTDDAADGVFAFCGNAEPRGRQLARGSLADQQHVAQAARNVLKAMAVSLHEDSVSRIAGNVIGVDCSEHANVVRSRQRHQDPRRLLGVRTVLADFSEQGKGGVARIRRTKIDCRSCCPHGVANVSIGENSRSCPLKLASSNSGRIAAAQP